MCSCSSKNLIGNLKNFKFLRSVLSRPQSNTTTTQEQVNPKSLFYIEDHKDKGYVIFKLNRAPVNSLNLEFLTELNIQLEKFEESKDFKGVILTSNLPNIFSAGLDIMEMYQCKPDRVRQFWVALQDFWLKLYGSNKIYIAAINVRIFNLLLSSLFKYY